MLEEDACTVSSECKMYVIYRDTYCKPTATPRPNKGHNVKEAFHNFSAFVVVALQDSVHTHLLTSKLDFIGMGSGLDDSLDPVLC